MVIPLPWALADELLLEVLAASLMSVPVVVPATADATTFGPIRPRIGVIESRLRPSRASSEHCLGRRITTPWLLVSVG